MRVFESGGYARFDMTATMHSPATYRTFRTIIDQLPHNLTGQVIGGRLVVLPRPAIPHAKVEGSLTTLLGGPFQYGLYGPGGWWILPEPERGCRRTRFGPLDTDR